VEVFGHAPDGSPVQVVTLHNGPLTARVMTWGASLHDLRMEGVPHSLVLGSPEFEAYLGPLKYAGAIVGRVANRIGGAQATIDGRRYPFCANEAGRTTLHGGDTGTGEVNWTLEEYDVSSCRMTVALADGQDGFPGAMAITAIYRLDAEGVLSVEMDASSDAVTWCNLAHHGYWTLDGTARHGGHRITIPAERYLAVDADNIPVGVPCPVVNSRFDFRQPGPTLGENGMGLDHCFCFDTCGGMRRLCRLEAGRVRLDVESDQPGLQVYDGRHFDMTPFVGHGGAPYGPYAGVALEAQGWPNAPNRPDFPSIRLAPGERYHQLTRYRLTLA